jgi:aspartate/methionine/tyrosine aminotransferase
MVERCRRGRDIVFQNLAGIERIRIARPDAAFYAFFKVEGVTDDLEFAKRLVREARVGLSPGSAFGPGNDGYLRLCFASAEPRLTEALGRLGDAFAKL